MDISAILNLPVDTVPLWVALLIALGVFLAGLMDAIAGGGGIISLPTYLLAFHGMPIYYAFGTNKLSAGLGTLFSTARFIKNGYVNWKLFAPSIALAVLGSVGGTWLQHHTPDAVLKYMLLAVLPVVAVITLRSRDWPGTGTFLMIVLIRFAGLDTRHAAGGVKVINLSSNIGSLITALSAGYVLFGVGLIAAVASMAGHYIGAGLAIKNGSKLVRPAVAFVLILLTLKVGSELLFPEFWN